ncbi:hypothetical protein J22TS1_41940 [Siminovitchia terrae]|uniref:hypothetical protein n=1 Tax=Siminovitchia terrae TaxID=1914933 RepID=UPI001AFE72C0|nr:hypothetical protein [Siminovitchia terrae]GIN93143.1 hypothetical protein J22TS1_41940 [Siminovitchia terrae]
MALDRLFELTEEVIKDKLYAEAVKIELDGDKKNRSFFTCTVKMDESTYIRTPKLLLQPFLIAGPEYSERHRKSKRGSPVSAGPVLFNTYFLGNHLFLEYFKL